MPSQHVHTLPRIRIPSGASRHHVESLLSSLKLNTVCQDAACPNRWECYNRGTATFLLLGHNCTRNCSFCNIENNTPETVDLNEPLRIAEAIEKLALSYAVITSVTRDDLPDGGAGHFATTLGAIHARTPDVEVEVLIPDFDGDYAAIETVLKAKPVVCNHNIETVARISAEIRPQASYNRSLAVLAYAARHAPHIHVKSGLMLGLGEIEQEIYDTLKDIYATGCRILTLGQYLSPGSAHAPVCKRYTEEEFAEIKSYAIAMGFAAVAAGPLVRSSYHADAVAHTALSNSH